jgi:hypothetical protein
MTRDEIENTPAGKEMDALIAREIFGMTIDKTFKGEWVVNPSYYVGSLGESRARGWAPKPYSTDIAAAWQVWEKLVEMERYPTLHQGPDENDDSNTYAYIELVNPADINAWADTVPLAICRAALLAVMT